jgi:RimJ/RimL family protein N-acetyltransferase
MVGFNLPHGSQNRMNVYYWTTPERRGHAIASRAVILGRPWALEAFGATEAFINATSEQSDRVAQKAGFNRLVGGILSWWVHPS